MGAMGYDAHITRKETWSDDEGPIISHSEWNVYVESDPEITPDPDNGSKDYLVHAGGEGPWPLWYSQRRGEIYTKNPTTNALRKMVVIASALDAYVEGDDGELYDEDILGALENPPRQPPRTPTQRRPWWKFW